MTVRYTYDAWGNILTTTGTLAATLGVHNPLRYRGYVYDHETGLYYLQSRYYNPALGRFLSADTFVSTGQGILGNNMFAYCLNNPVRFIDESGCLPKDTYMVEISGEMKRIPPVVIPDNIYTKKSGLINGQAICPYAEETMGLGTYADNGCGIIAVYNSMQLLGVQVSLASVDTDLYIENGYFACGLLGITLDSIQKYYQKHHISCTRYYSYSSMVASLSDGDVIVFMSMNNANNPLKGFHYMAAQYHSGQYVVYNPWSDYGSSITTNSLDPVYGKACWFRGFIVGG